MKLRSTMLAVLVLGSITLCTSCFECVVSLEPWFEVEDSEDAIFEARLLGEWCPDDGDCWDDELLYWAPGPGDSFNVFEDGRLRYRVWLGEVDGTSYLDWMFLCEPSRGIEDDDCLDVWVGSHLLAQVTLMEPDALEFRLLDREKFAEFLESLEDPLEHSAAGADLLVLEETDELREFVERFGRTADLWSDEAIKITRWRE